MGWERKRGKLHELNRLLRGATDTTFMSVAGRAPTVPRGRALRHHARCRHEAAARRGAPADRQDGPSAESAEIRRIEQRIVDGYAILQPRVTPSLPVGREGSLYQRVFSGPGGMDPYAAAVSDVYQDLFGEGSYTGKGIYDVDAFEAWRSPDASRKIPCSATTSSRASSRAPASPPMSRSSRSFRLATTSSPSASIAGRAATGSSFPWYSRSEWGVAPSHGSAAGKCWTICGARCLRRSPW